GGGRQHHVADGAEPQHEHRLRHAAPASRWYGAGLRQLRSGMRKVSTSACCPSMQACDTPSVSTIHAEYGAKEKRSCGGCWKEGVSFIQLWNRRIRRS